MNVCLGKLSYSINRVKIVFMHSYLLLIVDDESSSLLPINYPYQPLKYVNSHHGANGGLLSCWGDIFRWKCPLILCVPCKCLHQYWMSWTECRTVNSLHAFKLKSLELIVFMRLQKFISNTQDKMELLRMIILSRCHIQKQVIFHKHTASKDKYCTI